MRGGGRVEERVVIGESVLSNKVAVWSGMNTKSILEEHERDVPIVTPHTTRTK